MSVNIFHMLWQSFFAVSNGTAGKMLQWYEWIYEILQYYIHASLCGRNNCFCTLSPPLPNFWLSWACGLPLSIKVKHWYHFWTHTLYNLLTLVYSIYTVIKSTGIQKHIYTQPLLRLCACFPDANSSSNLAQAWARTGSRIAGLHICWPGSQKACCRMHWENEVRNVPFTLLMEQQQQRQKRKNVLHVFLDILSGSSDLSIFLNLKCFFACSDTEISQYLLQLVQVTLMKILCFLQGGVPGCSEEILGEFWGGGGGEGDSNKKPSKRGGIGMDTVFCGRTQCFANTECLYSFLCFPWDWKLWWNCQHLGL